MSSTWGAPDQGLGGVPPAGTPRPGTPGAGAPPPPDLRAGRGPWPLAPLTVPIVLVVATILAGVLGNVVVSELPWSEKFDVPGTFTFGLVFGGLLAGGLVLLSLTTRARPSRGRAVIGTVGTAAVFAIVATVANAATDSLGLSDIFIGRRHLFTDDPVRAVVIPYDLMLTSFADLDTLTVTWFDRPFVLTVVIALGVLMAVVGAGATIASGGTALSAALAGLGAAGGAVVGELFVQYGSFEWRDVFYDDLRGPTLLVLLPIVLSGIGIGLGALLGRPRRHRPVAPAYAGAPMPQPFTPPPPGPQAGLQQQPTTLQPQPGTSAPPPAGPPPGATPF